MLSLDLVETISATTMTTGSQPNEQRGCRTRTKMGAHYSFVANVPRNLPIHTSIIWTMETYPLESSDWTHHSNKFVDSTDKQELLQEKGSRRESRSEEVQEKV